MQNILKKIINLIQIKKPFFLNKETTVAFDIDDTLVIWSEEMDKSGPDFMEFKCPYTNESLFLKPHKSHINLLKKYKARNFGVMIWSAGGAPWAQEVINKLGLNEYVDLILTKPSRYVDDLDVASWIGNRVYIKEGHN
jgi:FMN phosphatase YigB (HAD superfamily)